VAGARLPCEQEGNTMKSIVLALALLVGGMYVVYRELVIEPVPIVQVLTMGAGAALIGALWLYWRMQRRRA
jgi:hypothetical protein